MLSSPTRGYGSCKLYKSVLPLYLAFARAHQDSETHTGTSGLQTIRTTARIEFTTQRTSTIQSLSIIKYNVSFHSHSVSSSQVSLYGPPLNQQCQDDLPRTSNLPLYQSLGPLLGHPLTQPCQDDLYSTMKCSVRFTQLSTISPPKDLRCPQRVQSTLQSSLERLPHCLQVPMSSHELGNLSIKSNIL